MDNIKPYFLPSEVARLVLGYLQDIGCKLTYKCFMKECTDLVEYSTLLKQGMAYPTKIMGLSLISIINEYAVCKLQENQSCQMSTSAASLWKQFDNVTKNLKKFSQNKVRQKESQTSRTRKLNQKIDRNFGCKKSNSSDMDVNGKNTSDEEWMSDNTSVIHEVSDNNGELDHSININTTSIKSSPSKSKTTLYGMKTPISKCKYNSKRKTKNSATKVKLTNKNIELGDIEKSETAQIQSFKRTTRSSLAKKNVNVTCLQGKSPPRKNLSVNSSVLLINEDKQNLEDRSVHSTEKTLDTSQLIDDMMNATELAPVGEASFLDKTFEVVNLREKCTCDINNENDKLVNLRETVLCDTEMNGNGYLENHANNTDCQMNTVKSGVQPSQAVTHAFSTVPNCDITDGNLQSQEIDEAIKNIPVPIVTPQNTFRPINVDENSNLKTPVKSFTQLYSDQQHRSPRRKRQPPKRRQDNNITVMGGLSPDVSTCSQFLPPGPDVDENTISDYPDILERLLGDTKLHEKLAENINKKLVPIKQTKDTIENIVLEEKIQPPVDENSNGSNDNLHSISDVIKGIADMTEHDPSFESLFSLFMSAKESSVHDEVDQMICQSTSTNQLSSTSHVQTSHDQTSLFNTSSEPTDVNVGQNNSNHSNQHLQQEQQVYSTQQSVILASSMNQNNNSNIADTTLQTHIQDNLSVTSPSSCDSLVQHNNYFQTSVGIAGRSVVQSVNRPDCLPFSSNQIRQPVTALSQLDNKINPIPYVVSVADAPHVYNIINLNSPAMSVKSIASPDPYIVPTPERIPNSQGKLRKPKRITPTPLCGNEVLPDIGKIASPHKPLNLIPEISGDKDYSATGCSPQVPSFQIQERHSTNSNSQPCDVVNTQTSVDTDTSLSNSLQYIGTEYPQLSQTEQENASVCDISTSPGGQNILFLNKRPFSTAKEENSSCVLSPITPVNEKSQSVSSTPHSMVPMSKNALSKPTTNLSPIQEFKKPNMLTRSSKKSTPKIQRLPRTENIVLTSYSLSPLKTDASVIHGSINQTAFTAVPLGKLSRRFCHVRNLDFGSNSEIIHSTDVVEMQPKKKIQMNKVVYSNLSTVTTSTSSTESGKKETVIKVNTDNSIKVRPLKSRHFSTHNKKSSVISNQLTLSKIDIQTTQGLVKSTKNKQNTKLSSKLTSPQVILSRVDQVSDSSKTRGKTNDKKNKKKPSAKDKILNINNSAKTELSCISHKSSPTQMTKSQSSRRKKNATPKKIRPLPPSFKVQAPADVIDLLDADTKEFNEHLEYVNIGRGTDKQVDQSMASNISLPIHKESLTDTTNHDETKEAAEVLASLAMPPLPGYCTPVSQPVIQSVDQDSGSKRKADESSNESWMSVNSLGTEPKKKRRKKTPDLKDVNIDLLLSKIRYKK